MPVATRLRRCAAPEREDGSAIITNTPAHSIKRKDDLTK
jgi:hypothetical protein